jgi:hypothetical protein
MLKAVNLHNAKGDANVCINPVPRKSYGHAGSRDRLKAWDVTIFNQATDNAAASEAEGLWTFLKDEHEVVTLPGFMSMLNLDASENLAQECVYLEVTHSGVLFALMEQKVINWVLCIGNRHASVTSGTHAGTPDGLFKLIDECKKWNATVSRKWQWYVNKIIVSNRPDTQQTLQNMGFNLEGGRVAYDRVKGWSNGGAALGHNEPLHKVQVQDIADVLCDCVAADLPAKGNLCTSLQDGINQMLEMEGVDASQLVTHIIYLGGIQFLLTSTAGTANFLCKKSAAAQHDTVATLKFQSPHHAGRAAQPQHTGWHSQGWCQDSGHAG